jgi:hypothetical protein
MFLRISLCVRLTIPPPNVSRLSIKCGILNILRLYRRPLSIAGITLLCYFCFTATQLKINKIENLIRTDSAFRSENKFLHIHLSKKLVISLTMLKLLQCDRSFILNKRIESALISQLSYADAVHPSAGAVADIACSGL